MPKNQKYKTLENGKLVEYKGHYHADQNIKYLIAQLTSMVLKEELYYGPEQRIVTQKDVINFFTKAITMSESVQRKIYKQYDSGNYTMEEQEHPRKTKFTQEHIEFIQDLFFKDEHLTQGRAAQIFQEKFNLTISRQTISNMLRRQGLVYTWQQTACKVDDSNKLKRFRISFKIQGGKKGFGDRIIFTDETTVQSHPNCRQKAWLESKNKNDPNKRRLIFKHSKYSVMFWGAIAKGYKSRLYYFVENANSYTYQDIIYEWYHYDFLVFLKQNHRNNWESYKRLYYFMQDNAKPHVAKETMEFMRYEKIKILKDWPPYSPDLNPIELMWAILKKKLRNQIIKDEDDLIEKTLEAWDEISIDCVDNIIDKIQENALLCIKNDGGLF